MSAKRLTSKGIRKNVSSVGSSENLKVVLPEKKDSTSQNLLTAAAQRLFSKSCKIEKENISQSRSKPEMIDTGKESKSSSSKANGTLLPVTPKSGSTGGRKTPVSAKMETPGGLSNRSKLGEKKPGTLLNNSKQNAKSSPDVQFTSSKLSQQSRGKSRQCTGRSEPKLHSTSEHPTSSKLVERVNGISKVTVERHSTKNLASKSEILSDISQNRLRSTSGTFSAKKLHVKPEASAKVTETPLNSNDTPSKSSREVGESLKLNVASLTKSTEFHSTAKSETRSASRNSMNSGNHAVMISDHDFPGPTTTTDSGLELDSIHNLNIVKCLSVDGSRRERTGSRETERNVKNGPKAPATASSDTTCISAGSKDSSSSAGSKESSSSAGSKESSSSAGSKDSSSSAGSKDSRSSAGSKDSSSSASSAGSKDSSSSAGLNTDQVDGMYNTQKQFTFDPTTCEIWEDDCLDKTMTEQRNEADYFCDDPFADVTLIPETAESEVFVEPPFANYFKCRQEDITEQSQSNGCRSNGCRSNGRLVGSVSRTSESHQVNVSEENDIPRKTHLRRTRQLLSLDSRHGGRSQSAIFAALGSRMPDPKTEESNPLRCVGDLETGSESAEDRSGSDGVVRSSGTASGGRTKEVDALSSPEARWSTVLRNCKKNIPLSSFVPYAQRLSMLPDHVASHPLDVLTDPGRRNPDCWETLGFPDAGTGTEIRPSRPLVQLSISSDSETVHGSRTSSESNLQSLHERMSIVDRMPTGFEGTKDPIERDSKDPHGLMSTHFLPKRPLSQICSRTINASNIWKLGGAPTEGLPHCHAPNSTCGVSSGNLWKSACNISAQIRAARSCSQRSFSPLPTIGGDGCGQTSFPGPSDLGSSAGPSGLVSSSSASTGGQASSSLEVSPTNRVFGGAVIPTQMENGARSRLSSFDRDFHLSTSSSRSRSSSFVSSAEEKQAGEIRKLRRELELANEKITSLTTQLNMNVVLATTYEQNLESMSQRHQHLATLLQEKIMELQKLKGFSSCDGELKSIPNSVNLQSSRRMSASFSNFSTDSKTRESSFYRQISSDSLNSESSSCSAASQPCSFNGVGPEPKKKSKKNWIKKSLSRAFSGRNKRSSYLTVEVDAVSVDSNPSYSDAVLEEKPSAQGVREMDTSDGYITTATRTFHEKTITDLKRQLTERDAETMDLKLDALSKAQQIEQLRATVVQLKKDNASLRSEKTGVKRQLVKPGQPDPSLTVGQASHVVSTGNDLRKASIVSSTDLDPTSRSRNGSVDFSIDGYPRLTAQESLIFSSPKFLHKFSLKSAITSVSVDDCFLPVKPPNPSAAITRTSSHRECRRKDYDKNHCRLDPKTTRAIDSNDTGCDSEGSSMRKTSSPLTTASPLLTSSEALRRNNVNGCPKSRNSTLLQSAV